jgi:hypothetical protein
MEYVTNGLLVVEPKNHPVRQFLGFAGFGPQNQVAQF